MKTRRACDPEGAGLRVLITSNVLRDGCVQRGAVAMATISAPPGTRFTSFRWAGTARRRDCRYALQLYAEAPDIDPIAIKNVRANQRCPRPLRAQAAGYRSRTFNVTGATRIVQRVSCVGGHGRKPHSARGSNYLRTYEAEVGIADVLAPAAAIIGDTPLARGEWVRGTQPLNYDPSDNIGVRIAHAVVAGPPSGSQQRPWPSLLQSAVTPIVTPARTAPGQINVNTTILTEGMQFLVVRAQDPAGNLGDSAGASARIDNTPPGRVDVSVEGGQEWRTATTSAWRG
jgi:hypothetical protein